MSTDWIEERVIFNDAVGGAISSGDSGSVIAGVQVGLPAVLQVNTLAAAETITVRRKAIKGVTATDLEENGVVKVLDENNTHYEITAPGEYEFVFTSTASPAVNSAALYCGVQGR